LMSLSRRLQRQEFERCCDSLDLPAPSSLHARTWKRERAVFARLY
jgi:hypothetical protein